MEPAQPADRVPPDATPPDGQPPARPTADATPPDGSPALVESPGPAAAAGDRSAPPADAGDRPAPPAGRDKARSERSPKDMVLSLLILLVPIALLIAFYRGFLGGDSPATVDPEPALEQARSANAFPVAAPSGLDSDWRTVTARFRTEADGATLRIGYVTPEGRGAQLVESDVPAEKLLPAELSDGQPQGPVDLPDGLSWQRYTARGNEQALVLLEPDRSIIVVGDAGETELRRLATSLR
ncbi:DUF4245 family protein [Micromonospora sp. WMMD1128]|uniref:DUF4245 domain-containing protein n=1 Tax=Micromonospora sp. WMMD1128 TaxID=3015150 RepID=UPI00248CF0DD|nr:DUF4245 family protein [Micromonospora sp. WMMD1128]WBB72809.1 DUF4245 family protein [Micromonospora sp. WMMD1128]